MIAPLACQVPVQILTTRSRAGVPIPA
jgi:hypothetical protein